MPCRPIFGDPGRVINAARRLSRAGAVASLADVSNRKCRGARPKPGDTRLRRWPIRGCERSERLPDRSPFRPAGLRPAAPPSQPLQPARPSVVRRCLRLAHSGAGTGLAGHRQRRARTCLRTHRLRQDARRLSLGNRSTRRPRARRPAAYAPGLRLAAQGAGLRHRAQPTRAAGEASPSRLCAKASPSPSVGRRAHRRHAREASAQRCCAHPPTSSSRRPSRCICCSLLAAPATILATSTPVIVDEIHAARPEQARRPPRALARAARGARPERPAPAHRLSAPRRARSTRSRASWSGRGAIAASSTPASQAADLQIHVPVESMTERIAPQCRAGSSRRQSQLDPLAGGESRVRVRIWPGHLPASCCARPRASLHHRLRQQPPLAERLALRSTSLPAEDQQRRRGRRRALGSARADVGGPASAVPTPTTRRDRPAPTMARSRARSGPSSRSS